MLQLCREGDQKPSCLIIRCNDKLDFTCFFSSVEYLCDEWTICVALSRDLNPQRLHGLLLILSTFRGAAKIPTMSCIPAVTRSMYNNSSFTNLNEKRHRQWSMLYIWLFSHKTSSSHLKQDDKADAILISERYNEIPLGHLWDRINTSRCHSWQLINRIALSSIANYTTS